MRFVILAVSLLIALPYLAQASSESRTMNFETCLGVIRKTSTDLNVAPINVVETNDMRIVRFPTADGSVLVTCSRSQRILTVTKSPR